MRGKLLWERVENGTQFVLLECIFAKGVTMSTDTLTLTDNRNGKSYEVPIEDGTIRAMDLRQIKISDDDFGLMTYDPAYLNTASCRSAITFIDGEKGILR